MSALRQLRIRQRSGVQQQSLNASSVVKASADDNSQIALTAMHDLACRQTLKILNMFEGTSLVRLPTEALEQQAGQ
jgi:hypothetical protein